MACDVLCYSIFVVTADVFFRLCENPVSFSPAVSARLSSPNACTPRPLYLCLRIKAAVTQRWVWHMNREAARSCSLQLCWASYFFCNKSYCIKNKQLKPGLIVLPLFKLEALFSEHPIAATAVNCPSRCEHVAQTECPQRVQEVASCLSQLLNFERKQNCQVDG